jgi:hypothetical protein
MLALVSHVFIRIQKGNIFASSNHRDVPQSIKFVPLILFTINLLPTDKLLLMCYPLNNYIWFFSGERYRNESKKK